ncbi:MAG TPA: glycerol-3-phosphate 1-O-acyltransferase PlsY [Sedimentisphaerales bacterium]|nr:glycerol-3-phosphate 1-O-acyltransferase PlsY [Sedimentisphaerales bacterium]HRS11985.1 glycerol-3-phosphate 1-O-acyltransferase PlsY [Sedimentisphaerales bacterium]HRV49041.1 glycerol-3-phosphate 1-O-acyltransferase PlsY [Sedimentisphaerales bacterium]
MSGVFVPAIAVAYLVGAIPFAQIIARAHGKDLRTIGSGNIGATNLARACGRTWGYACFALDVLKGLVPTAAARVVAGRLFEDVTTVGPAFLALWLAVGVAAILGHVFPVYLKFKGGKGVSTSFGVGLGLWPYFSVGALVALLVWILCAAIWRYVSLASICAAVSFPITLAVAIAMAKSWNLANLWPLLIAAIAIPLLVIVLHRKNIKRLLSGTESKIGSRKDRS